ncbi:MAG: hypothetical protein AB1916_05105 [Thermodesulfobacteriota bacterium]
MQGKVFSDLAYKGGRPYIRGADLLSFYLDLAGSRPAEYPAPERVDSLKLLREVERNGRWVRIEDSPAGAGGPEASASLAVRDAAGQVSGWAFLEQGGRILRRAPAPASVVERLVPTGDFAGEAVLRPGLDARGLLDGLVEANKAIHARFLQERGGNPASIRFTYLEGLPTPGRGGLLPGQVGISLSLRGRRSGGGLAYTLNLACISWPGGEARCLICYAFQPEPNP